MNLKCSILGTGVYVSSNSFKREHKEWRRGTQCVSTEALQDLRQYQNN